MGSIYNAAHIRAVRKYRKKLWYEFAAAYGGKCACCGEAASEFLTISHRFRDGGGANRKDTYQTLAELRREGWPTDRGITIDCFNCNMGAERNDGICPHATLGYARPVTGSP